ncbi:uncharacterized protein ZBAI_02297 [Zygosaccharomyces bailii ISA1307]|nr:uncharacterized protein ZBAI_02297 [Zygosaccharomyces bailii ISA1307]
MSYINCKEAVDIETNLLQKILEEVAEIDLVGNPQAWRTIAFRINSCFVENKYEYDSPIFYGGEQCRRFFVREIVKPIESTSYNIRQFYGTNVLKTYCQNTSHWMLDERAIANYEKSIAEYKNYQRKMRRILGLIIFSKHFIILPCRLSFV